MSDSTIVHMIVMGVGDVGFGEAEVYHSNAFEDLGEFQQCWNLDD